MPSLTEFTVKVYVPGDTSTCLLVHRIQTDGDVPQAIEVAKDTVIALAKTNPSHWKTELVAVHDITTAGEEING